MRITGADLEQEIEETQADVRRLKKALAEDDGADIVNTMDIEISLVEAEKELAMLLQEAGV